MTNNKKIEWQVEWGLAVFERRKKVKELRFRTEKDMVYAWYKLKQG